MSVGLVIFLTAYGVIGLIISQSAYNALVKDPKWPSVIKELGLVGHVVVAIAHLSLFVLWLPILLFFIARGVPNVGDDAPKE